MGLVINILVGDAGHMMSCTLWLQSLRMTDHHRSKTDFCLRSP